MALLRVVVVALRSTPNSFIIPPPCSRLPLPRWRPAFLRPVNRERHCRHAAHAQHLPAVRPLHAAAVEDVRVRDACVVRQHLPAPHVRADGAAEGARAVLAQLHAERVRAVGAVEVAAPDGAHHAVPAGADATDDAASGGAGLLGDEVAGEAVAGEAVAARLRGAEDGPAASRRRRFFGEEELEARLQQRLQLWLRPLRVGDGHGEGEGGGEERES